MDCGMPFCNNGCPVNNIIPDWNDLVYRGNWNEAIDGAALHQQLPGLHRPHLPGALRSRLHAEHRQRRRWASSPSSTRSSTRPGNWVWSAPARRRQDRQEGGRRRFRPCRPGGGPAAGPCRSCRDRVREEQPHRWSAAASASPTSSSTSRPSTVASRSWKPKAWCSAPGVIVGDDCPSAASQQRGQGSRRRRPAEGRLRRGAAGRWLRSRPRPAGAGPRAEGHAFRAGVPDPQQNKEVQPGNGQDPISANGQARRRDRRRRHRLRLRRHLQPPRRRPRSPSSS